MSICTPVDPLIGARDAVLSNRLLCPFHSLVTLNIPYYLRGLRLTQHICVFFIAENVQKLGQESRDEMGLAAINGIKAISMLFIIAGHALLFMVGGPIMNADFYAKVTI